LYIDVEAETILLLGLGQTRRDQEDRGCGQASEPPEKRHFVLRWVPRRHGGSNATGLPLTVSGVAPVKDTFR